MSSGAVAAARNSTYVYRFILRIERRDMTDDDRSRAGAAHGWRWAPLLLIIPYIGTLWVATYTSVTPTVWGIPFFYWYQLLWIAIGAVITIVVYMAEGSEGESHAGHKR